MTSPPNTSVLLVGPDPNKNVLGGVTQHMHILQSLGALQNAQLFDVGSIRGNPLAAFGIIINCIRLKKAIVGKDFRQVWINSSIYPSAFLKLLILMLLLRGAHDVPKRIFFHGGRFENIRMLKIPFIRTVVAFILKATHSFHFLSLDQGRGFEVAFPALEWELFRNYLPQNKALIAQHTEGPRAFLFVGRIVRSKGIFDILTALSHLEKTHLKDVQVWFAGDGEDLACLEMEAASQSAVTIKILGRQTPPALDDFYRRAFALLLPSYHQEGLPYVVIEALRAGLPIIATANGTIGEIIRSGQNGFLVPPKNPRRLGLAMGQLLQNQDLAQKIGQHNQQLFLNSFSKTAAETYYTRLRKTL